jgi:hypothetical protein
MRPQPLRSTLTLEIVATFAALIGATALAADTDAIVKQVSATLDRFYALSDQNR